MEKLNDFKAAVMALMAAMGTFLGWQGVMALVWVAAMGLDYLSGSAAACKEGKWSSSIARTGLWHKGGMIIVVAVAAIADGVLGIICSHTPIGLEWPGVILPLVISVVIALAAILVLAVMLPLGMYFPQLDANTWLVTTWEIIAHAPLQSLVVVALMWFPAALAFFNFFYFYAAGLIFLAVYFVLATFIAGTAAATRMKP